MSRRDSSHAAWCAPQFPSDQLSPLGPQRVPSRALQVLLSRKAWTIVSSTDVPVESIAVIFREAKTAPLSEAGAVAVQFWS